MNIDLHILTYNESDIIGLVLKHYAKFCRSLYVYDNHSTDNTREIAESMGAKVTLFGSKFFDDEINMNLKNNCWKGSDADWVIVCDCDECLFLHVNGQEKIKTLLWGIKSIYNASIIKTIGWQIMSNEMPKEDLLEITTGYHFDNYSKNIIFNPKAIKEINYNPGAHRINPVGDVVYSSEPLYVLHYKHIGGVERTIKRYKEYQKRMSPYNRKHGHGRHYNQNERMLRKEWNERMKISKPLI
jgi:glycosyltransferase involved in cell wall biosynthesis